MEKSYAAGHITYKDVRNEDVSAIENQFPFRWQEEERRQSVVISVVGIWIIKMPEDTKWQQTNFQIAISIWSAICSAPAGMHHDWQMEIE